MTDPAADLGRRFAAVRIWRRVGERAPHKPLLLLMRLAAAQRGEPRLANFNEIAPRLCQLLMEYGPARRSYHPENPFWYLRSDHGLWEITHLEQLRDTLAQRDLPDKCPTARTFREIDPAAGFASDVYQALRGDPDLVNRLTAELLFRHFAPSLHQDILDAVGMPWVADSATTTPRRRDPEFRDHVLRLYAHRCAVCSYDGRMGSADLGLEAAHLRWHAYGGDDHPENGIALCTFHHKMLDKGAIGINPDHRVLVSQHIHGGEQVDHWLRRFAGAPLADPQDPAYGLAPANIHWHRTEVFHGPEIPWR